MRGFFYGWGFCVAGATDESNAGGCPAAGYFLLRGQEKLTKEKAAPPHCPSGSLRFSRFQAFAELASLRQPLS